MSSTIGDVKTRLVEILTPALPLSQVILGPVDVTTLRPRAFVVGGAQSSGGESIPLTLEITNLDGSSGSELYTLTLTASVSLAGTDITVAETQAVADFRAAVAAIYTTELALDNIGINVVGSGELFETANAQGRSAAVRFPVEIFTTN